MRKAVSTILLTLTLCLTVMSTGCTNDKAGSLPTDGSSGKAEVSADSSSIGYAGSMDNVPATIGDSILPDGIYPYDIKTETFNDSPVIVKCFRVSEEVNPETLVENDFEENGFLYSRQDILKSEAAPQVEEKQVFHVATISTEKGDDATILGSLDPLIDYEEDGFVGQLELDFSSVRTVEAGRQSYSYPIRKVIDYSPLDNTDYYYLEKDKNNLVLQGANWVGHGSTQRGDILLPSSYTAKAVYTGIGYGSKVTGYDSTAFYRGTVAKTLKSDMLYSIVYKGVRIETESDVPWGGVLAGVLVLAAVSLAAFFVITKILPSIRKKKSPPPSIDIPG